MAVSGMVSPWLAVAGITSFQRRTPSASLAIGAALITVVDYRVLLVVIAVAAAASSLLIIGQPEIWRRPVPRPDAAASDSVAAADAGAAE